MNKIMWLDWSKTTKQFSVNSHRKFHCQYQASKHFKKKNFMVPFYGWGSTALRLEPLQGGSLLFTTKIPEISGSHFTDFRRMKG